MKRAIICIFAVYFLLGLGLTISAAEGTKSSSDKSVTNYAKDTAKKVKDETVKGYKETKDAIVRDAKAMKEDIPKGLKEAKNATVQQSKEIKESAKKEFKEIKEGTRQGIKELKNTVSNPGSQPKPETK